MSLDLAQSVLVIEKGTLAGTGPRDLYCFVVGARIVRVVHVLLDLLRDHGVRWLVLQGFRRLLWLDLNLGFCHLAHFAFALET